MTTPAAERKGAREPAREYTDLTPLFAPRSVALVGASDQGERFGTRVFRQLVNFGFRGPIYPVNPRAQELLGRKCYPNVAALPEIPDHVGIIVATERVFDMRIMGPNCNGVINFVDAFAMASTGAIGGPRRAPGNVGVVSHSGGLGQINVMWRAQEIGVGISYEASIGNEADLDSIDFARFMLRSDATDVVLMAIEGVKDGERLVDLAKEAAEREKPIVVLKFGRTRAGSRAAASHTGTLAGEDAIYDAAFRQFGLIRVFETNELYEMAILLRTRRWPKGRRAASAAATGGNIVQLADAGESVGIEWPEYSAATQAVLGELMPGYGKVSNPTDMTSLATGEPENFRRALDAIAADVSVDAVMPIFAFLKRADVERGAEFVRHCAKPAAMLWVGGCTDDRSFGAKDLVEAGVPVYRNALPCVRAVRAAADFGELVRSHAAGERRAKRPDGLDRERASTLLRNAPTPNKFSPPTGSRSHASGSLATPTRRSRTRAHSRARSRSRSTLRTSRTKPRRARFGCGCRATTRSARRTRRSFPLRASMPRRRSSTARSFRRWRDPASR
jgi:acetyltransferase